MIGATITHDVITLVSRGVNHGHTTKSRAMAWMEVKSIKRPLENICSFLGRSEDDFCKMVPITAPSPDTPLD